MHYLTADEVVQINARVMGGTPALRDRGMLESAVARPQTSVCGEDAYPTFYEKAAALLHSLIMNHPFVDGNKRTATLALVVFAKLNGYEVCWDEREALQFIVDVATARLDVPSIVTSLRKVLRWQERGTERKWRS
jgi:death-on-curing protein